MDARTNSEEWQQYLRRVKEGFFEAIDRIQHRNLDKDPDEVECDVAEVVEEVRRERHQQPHDSGHA
ncbi:MAG: hypothetical protein AB7R89_06790 [Dehalococcoidia bacterium]